MKDAKEIKSAEEELCMGCNDAAAIAVAHDVCQKEIKSPECIMLFNDVMLEKITPKVYLQRVETLTKDPAVLKELTNLEKLRTTFKKKTK